MLRSYLSTDTLYGFERSHFKKSLLFLVHLSFRSCSVPALSKLLTCLYKQDEVCFVKKSFKPRRLFLCVLPTPLDRASATHSGGVQGKYIPFLLSACG